MKELACIRERHDLTTRKRRLKATRARVHEVLRWEGIGSVLTRGLRKLLRPVVRVRCLLFFEMDLTRPFPAIEARVPLTMRVATVEDLDTFGEELTRLTVNLRD